MLLCGLLASALLFLSTEVALDDCPYFIGAGLDTFSGGQAVQYLASCYPLNTLLRVEFEVGLAHISEGF
jgi:hypothetical protein